MHERILEEIFKATLVRKVNPGLEHNVLVVGKYTSRENIKRILNNDVLSGAYQRKIFLADLREGGVEGALEMVREMNGRIDIICHYELHDNNLEIEFVKKIKKHNKNIHCLIIGSNKLAKIVDALEHGVDDYLIQTKEGGFPEEVFKKKARALLRRRDPGKDKIRKLIDFAKRVAGSDFAKAERYFLATGKLEPGSARIQYLIGRLYEEKGRSLEETGAEGGKEGARVMADYFFAKARHWYSKSRETVPLYSKAIRALARMYKRGGNKKMALLVLEDLLKINPRNPEYRMAIAKIHLAESNVEEAEKEFSEAVACGANPVDVGELYLRRKEYERAERYLLLAAEKEGNARAYEGLIQIRRKLEDWRGVIRASKEGLRKADPVNEGFLHDLEMAYLELKKKKKAKIYEFQRDVWRSAVKLYGGEEMDEITNKEAMKASV